MNKKIGDSVTTVAYSPKCVEEEFCEVRGSKRPGVDVGWGLGVGLRGGFGTN